jgi:hypothetical protein
MKKEHAFLFSPSPSVRRIHAFVLLMIGPGFAPAAEPWTGIWQMEFDTENPATHYQNGILSDLEELAIKRFKCGVGIAFIESWIQQVNNDAGAPGVLKGFVGRAFGIGPIVTYSTKLGKSHLDLSARWIHDFDVSKRVEGDGFNFTASLKF